MSPLANVETDRSADDFINATPNEKNKTAKKKHQNLEAESQRIKLVRQTK